MWNGGKIGAPVSVFAEFCAAKNEVQQQSLVRRAKSKSGKGGDHYAGFKRIVRTACQMGQDIHSVEEAFTRLITTKDPYKKRLPLLRDAFLDQWRKHDYQFFKAQWSNVTIASTQSTEK